LGEGEDNTCGCDMQVSERRSGVVRPDACMDVSCAVRLPYTHTKFVTN
jgi:hypothetical protein